MGQLFSSEQKNEDDNFDTITIWGSDIDEELCGPGKICADQWTPLNSLSSTPEPSDSNFEVITQQPMGYTETLVITPEPIQYDHYGLNEDYDNDDFIPEEPPKIPVEDREEKKKEIIKSRRKIMKKKKNNKVHVIIEIGNNQRVRKTVDLNEYHREPIRIRHQMVSYPEIQVSDNKQHFSQSPRKPDNQKIKTINHRPMVHQRYRKPIYRETHLPKVPAPSPYNPQNVPKFIQRNRHEIVFTRVVPPNRYRGLRIDPPDPFRVRRVSNNYQ